MKNIHKNGDPFSVNGKPAEPQWDDIKVFLSIARNGSMNAAASALTLGIATVSRRLERLEAALGVRLFIRHQNGYRLTDDGTALIESAEKLEQAGLALGVAVERQGQIGGRVRLTTTENVANRLIIPSLPALLIRHPALSLDMVTGVDTLNLHRRDADLAVRLVRPETGNVAIRRLGTIGFGLYGASAYLQQRSDSPGESGFAADRFIAWSEAQSHLPAALWIERICRGKPNPLTTTSLAGQIAAAQAGIGLAVLPHFLARPAGLTCVRSDLGIDRSAWLVIHADLTHSRRVRAVADHLVALFDARGDELSGATGR